MVLVPRVPNYILSASEADVKWPLSDFEEEQLRAIGAEWTEELVRRAKEQRLVT
jgi:hypothetical protein